MNYDLLRLQMSAGFALLECKLSFPPFVDVFWSRSYADLSVLSTEAAKAVLTTS